MAIVLDINFLSEKMFDMDKFFTLLKKYQMIIKNVNSIDNWMWENEQRIVSLEDLEKNLNNNRIIIIKLEKNLIKDLGVYIEKKEGMYLLNLWINTEGYTNIIDSDVCFENTIIYKEVCKNIAKIEENFKAIGIGLETSFYISDNIQSIISNSRNVQVWILPNNIEENSCLSEYRRGSSVGKKLAIWEKKN